MEKRLLRIHGDNIVECERTLKMIAEAFGESYKLLSCPIYLPRYSIKVNGTVFEIELISGHGRWGEVDLGNIIHNAGGKLRETADAYITEIKDTKETILLALEYCSALPAGNNAWQRNGRALACVLANVPYLYYAEIGGVELDDSRKPKAPRYPNPAVPFSYVSLSHDMSSICLPVYRAHPSMTEENYIIYRDSLGYEEGLLFIKSVLTGEETHGVLDVLSEKALSLVKILSDNRRAKDTLCGEDWNNLLEARDRTAWLVKHGGLQWKKKSGDKVNVSNTFNLLKAKVEELSAKPIAARDLPFCILPKNCLHAFKQWIKDTYNGLETSFSEEKDLAIVWITGFKPKGDDSRPDRGLSALCRMILGKNANIMAVVSGPGTPYTWNLLFNDPKALCETNGLFQAIYVCCNYLFIDSVTCDQYAFIHTGAAILKKQKPVLFPFTASPSVSFSEHDTDCGIHQILSGHEDMGIYECFCNPPGGDWSGISYFKGEKQYKWTSLPRVSDQSKRPDHIFQIEKDGIVYFMPIESKGWGKDLENNIGKRLKDYINDLFGSNPTACKLSPTAEWRFFDGNIGKVRYKQLSVGAFLYKDESELNIHLKRGKLDAVLAFEFGEISILHIHVNRTGRILLQLLMEISSKQGSFIVQVH